MKRITFLAAFIVTLITFGTAKAQVSGHIGINFGQPAYYAPAPRVVVVDRGPVYDYPVRSYYRRPVVVRRPVIVHHRYYGHPGRGHAYGRGRW
ncbi:hypothetical protein [Mucilaginibacter sp. PAMB04168]|uniref:hypothetical protein n=1 Tax=Mucilaginibacter sp. PAMB04168 TaxID=3138567 RepID=UPI0031F63E02